MLADSGVPVVVTAAGCPDAGAGVRVLRVDDPAEARRIGSLCRRGRRPAGCVRGSSPT